MNAAVSDIRALVFDAYGTLFDVAAVRQACAGVMAQPDAFVALWRAKQLEYAFLRSLMGRYANFDQVTYDALHYASAATNTTLSSEQRTALLAAWYTVAPFPDTVPALQALKARGITLAILSNGTPAMLERLVQATSMDGMFDFLLSVDSVRRYKPDPAVYALIEPALGLGRTQVLFVSSNGWDAAGARAFGLPVCWVNRAATPTDQLDQPPTYSISSLAELLALL